MKQLISLQAGGQQAVGGVGGGGPGAGGGKGPTLLSLRGIEAKRNINSRGGLHADAAAGVPRAPELTPAHSTASTPTHVTGPMAGSLNTILGHLWPRISAYTTELIRTEVQPQLQANLPSALQGLAFDTEKCHLGQRPFEFRRIHIDKESQITATGTLQNLVFQARFEWDADCEVYLTFAGAGFGIQGLSIRGVVLLELVGLLDAPPFFEGIRVFFNNEPEIDIQFQGAGAGMLNLSIIRNKIVDVVTKSIRDLMVVPNRLGYTVVPEADIFRIKSPPAQGMLYFTIWDARELLAMDHSWFRKPSSDPYVIVRCGAYYFKSPTKYKTLNPDFAHTVAIPISEAAHQRVHLELFDEDLLSGDDFLGKLSLPVNAMIAWGHQNRREFQLEDEHGQRGKSGGIRVSAEWRPLLLDTARANTRAQGLVAVGVHSATQVPRICEGAQFSVVVRCAGIMDGFPDDPKETNWVAESPENQGQHSATDTSAEMASMRSRLMLLKQYNMSEQDMAKVLQVDVQRLHDCLMHRSTTQAAGDLATATTQELQWESGFEFPLAQIGKSKLTFDLMCQPPRRSARVLGTYECDVSELLKEPNCTAWRTVEVSGSSAVLKLKLCLRHLGEVSNVLNEHPGSSYGEDCTLALPA